MNIRFGRVEVRLINAEEAQCTSGARCWWSAV